MTVDMQAMLDLWLDQYCLQGKSRYRTRSPAGAYNFVPVIVTSTTVEPTFAGVRKRSDEIKNRSFI